MLICCKSQEMKLHLTFHRREGEQLVTEFLILGEFIL